MRWNEPMIFALRLTQKMCLSHCKQPLNLKLAVFWNEGLTAGRNSGHPLKEAPKCSVYHYSLSILLMFIFFRMPQCAEDFATLVYAISRRGSQLRNAKPRAYLFNVQLSLLLDFLETVVVHLEYILDAADGTVVINSGAPFRKASAVLNALQFICSLMHKWSNDRVSFLPSRVDAFLYQIVRNFQVFIALCISTCFSTWQMKSLVHEDYVPITFPNHEHKNGITIAVWYKVIVCSVLPRT